MFKATKSQRKLVIIVFGLMGLYYFRKEIGGLFVAKSATSNNTFITSNNISIILPTPTPSKNPTFLRNTVILLISLLIALCIVASTPKSITSATVKIAHKVHTSTCNTQISLAYETSEGASTKCWSANTTNLNRQLRGTLVVNNLLLATFSSDHGESKLFLLLKLGQYQASQLPSTNLWSLSAICIGAGTQSVPPQTDGQSGPPYNANGLANSKTFADIFYAGGKDSFTDAGTVIKAWPGITSIASNNNHVVVEGTVTSDGFISTFRMDVPFWMTREPAAYFGWLGTYNGERLTILPTK